MEPLDLRLVLENELAIGRSEQLQLPCLHVGFLVNAMNASARDFQMLGCL